MATMDDKVEVNVDDLDEALALLKLLAQAALDLDDYETADRTTAVISRLKGEVA